MRFRRAFRVDRPAGQVFAYAGDLRNLADWDPAVVASSATTAGPYGVGTELLLEAGLLGGRMRLRYRVVAYEPPRLVRMAGGGRRWSSVDTLTVTPTGRGSEVAYDADVELRGPLRLAAPLVAVLLAAGGARALAGLRKALHALPPSG
ncbi:MAG: SRPBCC family protein [Thermoleophilia bacterium]